MYLTGRISVRTLELKVAGPRFISCLTFKMTLLRASVGPFTFCLRFARPCAFHLFPITLVYLGHGFPSLLGWFVCVIPRVLLLLLLFPCWTSPVGLSASFLVYFLSFPHLLFIYFFFKLKFSPEPCLPSCPFSRHFPRSADLLLITHHLRIHGFSSCSEHDGESDIKKVHRSSSDYWCMTMHTLVSLLEACRFAAILLNEPHPDLSRRR